MSEESERDVRKEEEDDKRAADDDGKGDPTTPVIPAAAATVIRAPICCVETVKPESQRLARLSSFVSGVLSSPSSG